jgi:hypothetical protein
MINHFIRAMEKGQIPDAAIRFGIRKLCKDRLDELETGSLEGNMAKFEAHRKELLSMPLAVHTDAANEQHYEIPAEYFHECLGKNLKYSSCYWPREKMTLEEAEEEALRITCDPLCGKEISQEPDCSRLKLLVSESFHRRPGQGARSSEYPDSDERRFPA